MSEIGAAILEAIERTSTRLDLIDRGVREQVGEVQRSVEDLSQTVAEVQHSVIAVREELTM